MARSPETPSPFEAAPPAEIGEQEAVRDAEPLLKTETEELVRTVQASLPEALTPVQAAKRSTVGKTVARALIVTSALSFFPMTVPSAEARGRSTKERVEQQVERDVERAGMRLLRKFIRKIEKGVEETIDPSKRPQSEQVPGGLITTTLSEQPPHAAATPETPPPPPPAETPPATPETAHP